jgi:hypothetical protein
VHVGTNVIILQAVTCLMAMKSKYNFLNQCYIDIVKLIIDLIPAKHNMWKYLFQSKMIVVGLGINFEKIDVCEKNCILLWKEHKDDTECMHCGRFRYVKVIHEDQKCQLNLRVAYLWYIHDYLAYDKFVGCCVHDRLNCPIYMDDSDAFRLEYSRKVTFFNCH